MDQKQAQAYLKNIDRSDASIKRSPKITSETAAFFAYYRHEAPEIAQLFLNEITTCESGDRKILLIYIIHEIIMLTLDRGDEFIKGFGDQLRPIVDQIKYFFE
jgi:hypothetical protein